MRILLILLAACAIAHAQSEPITLYSSTAPGIGTIKIVGQDTLTLLWNGGANDRHIKQSRYIPGEAALQGEPTDLFPGYASSESIGDVKQLADGTLLLTFDAVHGNESSITKFAVGPAPFTTVPIYQSQWEGPQCWFSCFDLTNTKIFSAPNGDIFIVGAENSYFDIGGGAREVDTRPLVFRLSPGNYSLINEYVTESYFAGEIRPIIVDVSVDSLTVLSNNSLAYGSILATWPLNGEFPTSPTERTLSCNAVSYGESETLILPSGRILAANDLSMYEITTSGECTLLGSFTGNSGYSSLASHPNFGIAEITATFSSGLVRGLFVSRLDTTGAPVATTGMAYWQRNDSLLGIPAATITDDGTIHIIWEEYARWPNNGYQLKYVSLDWETPLASPDQHAPAIPDKISLSAYPNPFNSTVTISFDLPQAAHITLTAYDLQGRVVSTLLDGFAPSGNKELHWSPKNLASGVYFLTLRAPNTTATQKLLYLK
jgi:hypothetical protein